MKVEKASRMENLDEGTKVNGEGTELKVLTQELKQDILNRAVAGLASQGFTRSVDIAGGCLYRGLDGKKCALGHVMPDEKYRHSLEGSGPTMAVCEALGLDWRSTASFLGQLQECHDHAYEVNDLGEKADRPDRMKTALRRFAEVWCIDIPEVLAPEGSTQS